MFYIILEPELSIILNVRSLVSLFVFISGPEFWHDRVFCLDDLEGSDGGDRIRVADRRRPQRVDGAGLPQGRPPLLDQLRAGGHQGRRDRRL